MPKDTKTISNSLKELETIVEWFDNQADIDIEQGLKKVKQGAVIIQSLRTRIENVSNEFQKIKKDFDGNDEEEEA